MYTTSGSSIAVCEPIILVYYIDVENIDLQLKNNKKNIFFIYIKTCNNIHKTLNYI